MTTKKQYMDFVRGVKEKECKAISKMNKGDIRDYAIKLGWGKLTDIQRQAKSKSPVKREKKEQKEEKEQKGDQVVDEKTFEKKDERAMSIEELRGKIKKIEKEIEAIMKKAGERAESGRGQGGFTQKEEDTKRTLTKERLRIVKAIKMRQRANVLPLE